MFSLKFIPLFLVSIASVSTVLQGVCHDSLTSDIPDSSITASSHYYEKYGTNRARLHTQEEGPKIGAWCAHLKEEDNWLQVDLLKRAQVQSVTTQGRNGCPCSQWVTKYTVEYSLDGTTWTPVTKETGFAKIFNGNTDKDTTVTNSLGDQVIARYVRIRVQEWHERACMRVDVNGCFVGDQCPELRTPNNGSLLCEDSLNGTVCRLQCENGYDVAPTTSTTAIYVCDNGEGTWNNITIPDCTGVDLPCYVPLFLVTLGCKDTVPTIKYETQDKAEIMI